MSKTSNLQDIYTINTSCMPIIIFCWYMHVMGVVSAVYREPDIIHTSGRNTLRTVKETGGKDTPNPEYEIVATNRAMPSVSPSVPHTSHTSQPTSC